MIQDALRYHGVAASDLAGVAVSMGPGSYTGLRIGVSAAKGLCMAVGVPLVGVPSLEAAAHVVAPLVGASDRILVAAPARRDEWYLALYEVVPAGVEERWAPRAVTADRLPPVPDGAGRLWIVGQGARDIAELVRGAASGAVCVLPDVGPTAISVGRMGAGRLARGETVPVDTFEPFYLKDFIPREPKPSLSTLSPGSTSPG
jgi:tRNA threonylcarbamoyladenosine biosynthesis protein TsaB